MKDAKVTEAEWLKAQEFAKAMQEAFKVIQRDFPIMPKPE